MADKLTVKTNHHPRDLINWYDLTPAEQREFDYLDTEERQDCASFVRFKGNVYDVSEFQITSTLPADNPLRKWSGFQSDSFFSGVVLRWHVEDGCEQFDRVVMGTFYN